MNTIEEDIELAKLWANHTLSDPGTGEGWRHVSYRLAVEVERLRESGKQAIAIQSDVIANLRTTMRTVAAQLMDAIE